MNKTPALPTASVDACQQIITAIERLTYDRHSQILVALDGGSGAGKSTLAAKLEKQIEAAVVPLDDFFAAHIPDWEWETRSVEARARDVLDWERVRVEALLPLRAGQNARWHPFDFAAGLRPDGTYGLSPHWAERKAMPVIILEGAYSAHPKIADLIDLTVLVDVPIAKRHKRLAEREDPKFLEHWHAVWDAVENYYFTEVRPKSSFDLIVLGE